MARKLSHSALGGAAFLMATAAVGPGFITQTTVYTQQLLSSFGFVILCSILLDMAAQLNIWRIVTVSGKRAQDIANEVFPGMGYLLALLIVSGGLAFNIGNIGGAALGMNLVFPIDQSLAHPIWAALLSTGVALFIFWVKDAGKAMDLLVRILGLLMIGLTLLVAYRSHPPLADALRHTVAPQKIDVTAILTLVGGTVGGYISFAGAHRLLDAGCQGTGSLKAVTKASVRAILLASLMRILLFLAALGVVMAGARLDPLNPPASVFSFATGAAGKMIFGVVLWSAALSSVVGAAYTSISFLRSLHPWLNRNHRMLTTLFILVSMTGFALLGQKPVKLLVTVGTLNGFILPLALALMLLALHRKPLREHYKHPLLLSIAGWAVVAVMSWMSVKALLNFLH